VGSDLQGLPAGNDFNATEKKLEGNSFASDTAAIDKDARQHQPVNFSTNRSGRNLISSSTGMSVRYEVSNRKATM